MKKRHLKKLNTYSQSKKKKNFQQTRKGGELTQFHKESFPDPTVNIIVIFLGKKGRKHSLTSPFYIKCQVLSDVLREKEMKDLQNRKEDII